MTKTNLPIQERFEMYISPEPMSGCWLWAASCHKWGYGRFRVGSKKKLAHRVSWEIYNGPIPDGLCVLHKCDVPECVNPDHLFLGTNADNAADRSAKGRDATRRGENNGRAKITDKQAREIYLRGGTQRETAAHYGIGESGVSRIKSGDGWAHATQDLREKQ
ncbi:MAG: HNH endonuclease [Rhodospirillaceae bacterium]|nr:HNH endonuclease [Rhodospirillaceae bacterium]